MRETQILKPWLQKAACAGLLAAAAVGSAQAVELHVMTSGGFTAAYQQLGPGFTKATGNTLDTILGPSMGQSPQAIPSRLDRGEPGDVVIMVGYALDDLIKKGKVIPDSRVELSDSSIGMVVRKGQPKPDIRTVDAFRKTLLNAKSIGYSDSASGVYIEKEMFKKLGIEDQVKGKAKMIERIPVAGEVANGHYQYGFQQVSELLPIKGITFVGKIPAEVQSVTRYAAGIPVNAPHPEEARALLKYLSSPQAQAVIKKTGMDPVVAK